MQNNKGFLKEVANGKACLPLKAQKQHATGVAVQSRRNPLPNKGQFVRLTASVLLVLGLIAVLLPGRAAAQGGTIDSRAAWVINQAQNAPVSPATRDNARGLIGRLAYNNGNDPVALEAVSKWFTTSWEGGEFNYPAIGLLANRYWDKFTQAQRDTLKESMKNIFDFWSHGTENHAMMRASGGYLLGQLWPNEAVFKIGGVSGYKTGAEIMATCKERIMSISKSLFYNSSGENLSTTYLPHHIGPWSVLYDEADDPVVKAAADAALNYHLTHLASNHFEGLVIPPIARENMQQISLYAAWQARGYIPGAQRDCWLYWGDPDRAINGRWDWKSLTGASLFYLSTSGWRPNPAINSIALQTAPQEIKGSWSHGTYWGGIQPANDPETGYSTPAPFSGLPGEVVRYAYREELFAMGGAFYQYDPGNFYTQNCAFALHYRTSSNEAFQTVEVHHPYWLSNTPVWEVRNSPFMQIAQHKSTAIVLFNIPTDDPWYNRGRSDWKALRDQHFNSLIQEGLLHYPKTIDEMVESNGWVFLREGNVYIAVRPLRPYTIDTNDATAITHPNTDKVYFNVVRSAFAQTGFIIDVATSADFASFAAFQSAVSASTLTINTSLPSATYTNVKGETISATWNPPDYLDTAAPVRVRADLTVNGTVVPVDETYPVLKTPYANVANGLMQLQTPEGQLVVDWTGDVPVFSGSVPSAPSDLSASASSSSQINLSWVDSSGDEHGFKIERKTGSGGTWGQIATVGANVTTYSNTGLLASTTCYYRVRAYNSAGNSAYSNEANATTEVVNGINDTHFQNLLIYPNPAHDYLVIDKVIPLANPVKIDLVNVSGISVHSAQEVTLPYILKLKGMNPGIYFLKIHFSEGVASRKIIVK